MKLKQKCFQCGSHKAKPVGKKFLCKECVIKGLKKRRDRWVLFTDKK